MTKPIFIVGHDAEFADIFWQDYLPGYSAFLAHHCELRQIVFPQPFGTFGERAYNGSCQAMIRATAQALLEQDGRIVVMSDCDMRIYRDFWPEIEAMASAPDFQMATAMDRMGTEPVHCGGFIVVKSSEATMGFFKAWGDACDGLDGGSVQDPMNALIRSGNVKVDALPETYWTIGLGDLPKIWEPGDAVPEPPDGICFHHANFTVGARNKRALMASVALRVRETRLWP